MESGQSAVGKNRGIVYLVGAGPGDPGALTLRAAECLRLADLVLYDYLVNPLVLEHARAQAERFVLGHHRTGRTVSQEEINCRMIEAVRQGKTVVRLKAGDPCVFGHAAEEIEALRAAGVSLEIVPGITAGLAVGDYAEVPITHGLRASAIALATGHQRPDKAEPVLDYAALAGFPGTLVFYMGVTSATVWSAALVAGGRSPDTPVAIVRRCSWPDQEVVRSTLGTVASVVAESRIRPPAVIVVGDVVGQMPIQSWFASRPLSGQRVVVTRPADRADTLRQNLSELGAEVLVQPAVRISLPESWAAVDAALAKLQQYDWLVFSSANGVRGMLERLLAIGGDLRRLGGTRLAAIGPGTAAELARYHLRADFTPDEFRAEALADGLVGGAAGRRFLLARTNVGRQVLPERLAAAGGAVEQIVVYTTTEVEQAETDVAEALAAGQIDWITVTSSAIARAVVRLFGGDDLKRARLASISPITSAALRALGHEPAVEARQYTMAGLVEAIVGTVR